MKRLDVDNRWNLHGRPKTLSENDIGRLIENCREDRTMDVKERKYEVGDFGMNS